MECFATGEKQRTVDPANPIGDGGGLTGGYVVGIFLLIIAGLVAWFFISAMNRAKARMAYADAQMAERAFAGIPTWARSKPKVDRFVEEMYALVEERAIARGFFTDLMTDPAAIDEVMLAMADAERAGALLDDQKAAAVDFVAVCWAKLNTEEQERYAWKDFGNKMRDASLAMKRLTGKAPLPPR